MQSEHPAKQPISFLFCCAPRDSQGDSRANHLQLGHQLTVDTCRRELLLLLASKGNDSCKPATTSLCHCLLLRGSAGPTPATTAPVTAHHRQLLSPPASSFCHCQLLRGSTNGTAAALAGILWSHWLIPPWSVAWQELRLTMPATKPIIPCPPLAGD